MEISNFLKEFLDNPENQILINKMDKNSLQELYYNLIGTPGVVTEFTRLLFRIGIEPAKILEFIPMQYMYKNDKLKQYEIPYNVTIIDNDAFSGCENLTIIVIPNTITYIGKRAFQKCFSLKDIVYKGTIDEWRRIKKGADWDLGVPAFKVICTDGVVNSND